jgi:hypothetical protein
MLSLHICQVTGARWLQVWPQHSRGSHDPVILHPLFPSPVHCAIGGAPSVGVKPKLHLAPQIPLNSTVPQLFQITFGRLGSLAFEHSGQQWTDSMHSIGLSELANYASAGGVGCAHGACH